ncbi:DUF4141 domain-containing protein [Luteimonas sp. SX5]|uniref:DUF4141 domain-containing protein n=1 Tax=Luteimonas galliterrae TaxID=2940486 RepID=A0ABT0MJT1_9GAMM|nr:DUF4141 domain-containing protein [Luteimonas galliterrae]MCL1635121.1 DUF4141 domain-containing protein [Luteimonas galliterrae]
MKNNKGIQGRQNRCAAVATLCFGLLMAGSAEAQWTVTDPGHTLATVDGWVVQGAEIGEQLKRWEEQTKRWQTQLADAKSVFKSQDMDMTMDFSERPRDYGMAESCPEKKFDKDRPITSAVDTGLSAISSWQPLKLDNSANLKKDMLDLCKQIVVAKNMKYNETVRLLKLVKQRESEMKKLDEYRQRVGTSQGMLATSSNQLSALSTRMQMDVQYSEAVINTYDALIASRKLDQEKITQRILKGSDKGLVSVVLQGAALKGTFAGLRAIKDR